MVADAQSHGGRVAACSGEQVEQWCLHGATATGKRVGSGSCIGCCDHGAHGRNAYRKPPRRCDPAACMRHAMHELYIWTVHSSIVLYSVTASKGVFTSIMHFRPG